MPQHDVLPMKHNTLLEYIILPFCLNVTYEKVLNILYVSL